MAFKFFAFATLLAYANAGLIPSAPLAYAAAPAHISYGAPVAKAVVAARAEDYDPNPQYSYGYDIQDGLTGDSKSHSETRNGDVVQGSYSLVDPDGIRRTVDYTADPVHGFNAVVRREPLAVKTVAKVAAPVAYAAPASYAKFASPVAYAAPATYAAHPAAYAAHPAPVAYAAGPTVHKVSYASPAIAYHH